MHALTWQGTEKLSVETVADPTIQEDTDALIRVSSTAIWGSDLHLYSGLGMFLDRVTCWVTSTMRYVEGVGPAVTNLEVGDRVVVPFVIAGGHCVSCTNGLDTQCAVGQMSARIAAFRGAGQVLAADFVPERLEMARRQVLDLDEVDDPPEAMREHTDGRGPDSVVDAVGMEAHGSPVAGTMARMADVRHWIPEGKPPVEREDYPLGGLDLRTHRVSLEDAPQWYETFHKKQDGCIKVVLDPSLPAGSRAA